MYHWKAHLAYGAVERLAFDGTTIYAKTRDALFTVNTDTEEVIGLSKLTGLNGAEIGVIGYNRQTESLIIVYQDGLIDVVEGDAVYSMTDLKMKEINGSKSPNNVTMYGNKAYLAMSFGVMCIDLSKREVADTYFFGDNGYINITDLTVHHDTLVAISGQNIYRGDIKSWTLSDFHTWEMEQLSSSLDRVLSAGDSLWVLSDTMLYCYGSGGWGRRYSAYKWQNMTVDGDQLYLMASNNAIYSVNAEGTLQEVLSLNYPVQDLVRKGKDYWLATQYQGVVHRHNGNERYLAPNGPCSNMPYRLKFDGGKVYMVPGSRWASQDSRAPEISFYNGSYWHYYDSWTLSSWALGFPVLDIMNIAVDPFDQEHFWATSYGTGLYEFKNNALVRRYDHTNSPLVTLVPGQYAQYYIRTDAATYDADGNLWFINCGTKSMTMDIISPAMLAQSRGLDSVSWFTMPIQSSGVPIPAETPQEMFFDNRNSHYLWIPIARVQSGVGGIVLLDDKGTPFNSADDRAIERTSFTDADNKRITMERVLTAVQDLSGDIWVGHDKGTFVIRHTTDFFKSDAVERIKIPRNDGTNLADYLLNGVQVNAIAIDGSNRKWIGTATSGLYLMSADGITTIEHFTEENSPLLNNEILSLAINPESGELFVGTAAGVMSYQSDATVAKEDFSGVYAYPNPVRPDYSGVITIAGLMDETVCYILDAGGNLIAKTQSNGGTAVWNGLRVNGEKATPGIYSVLCNTADGGSHTVTKIMLMR